MSNSNSQDQGSFLTGLTLGMFAGATGFFLFGTKNGKNIRQKLTKEWDAAKLHLFTQGKIDNPHLTLKDLLNQFISSMSVDLQMTPKVNTKVKVSKNTKTSKTADKFKNT